MDNQISVIINGECNHASYEIETEEFDDVNPHGTDQSYTLTFRVCTRCKAYRRIDLEVFDDEGWHGETTLAILPATNVGEIFHDVQKLPF